MVELEVALAQYADALTRLNAAKSQPSQLDILEILNARDAIRQALANKTRVSSDHLAKLLELDNFLKTQADAIALNADLEEWRATFHPSPEAWWWFLELTPNEETSRSNRYDWLFNTLTIAGLTGVAAYTTTFVQLFSTGGVSFAETFGLLGQGGLLLTAIHTLQDKGQEKIENLLKKLNISPQFHSQATLAITAMLLLASVGVYRSLPQIAEWNYQQGEKIYKKGLLEKAKGKYEQAAKLDPKNSDIQIALGEVYESLGDIEGAKKEYQKALEKGNVRAFNNLGRVYLNKKDWVTAESLLRMGLRQSSNNKADNVSEKNAELNYQLHRNLGWVLLEQKNYQMAEKELRVAVKLDQNIPEKQIGGGMAYCLLEDILEEKENATKERSHWREMCLTYARPETLNEYKWFIETQKHELADTVDTTGIVN